MVDMSTIKNSDLEVYEAMKPYFDEMYGNAASIYRFAGESRKAVVEEMVRMVSNMVI